LSYESLVLSVATTIMTLSGLLVPVEEAAETAETAGVEFTQPAAIDLTSLKDSCPHWHRVLFDGHDILLDLCLQRPYGAWLDQADRTGFYLLCRDVLAEARRLYLDIQLARPVADQDLPEPRTFSIFCRSFKK
jgi:hypothetical protein